VDAACSPWGVKEEENNEDDDDDGKVFCLAITLTSRREEKIDGPPNTFIGVVVCGQTILFLIPNSTT